MARADYRELRRRMQKIDQLCWCALMDILERQRAGAKEVERLQQKAAESLCQLEDGYVQFLTELLVSDVSKEEVAWHQSDVSSRHAMQHRLAERALGHLSPMKSFDAIIAECSSRAVEHRRVAVAHPLLARPYRWTVAAVWGPLDLEWLLQDSATKKRIVVLREQLETKRPST